MKIAVLALFLAIPVFAQNPSANLAPSCGPRNVTFSVNVDAAKQTPAQSEHGKALVYFFQHDGPGGDHQHYTIKIGMDGAWVGAYKHNSYFAVSVGPGEHHVCANVQSKSAAGHNVALAHFTAEPGKVYYFRTQFLAGLTTQYPVHPYLSLDRPDSDQAKYMIVCYPQSVWQPIQ